MKNREPLAVKTRPEDELLLCCGRAHLEPEGASQISMLAQRGLAWDYLYHEAALHGLIPLLYRRLHAICPEAIPESALNLLKDLAHQNTAWNLLLMAELLGILSLFAAHGISAIPFKGPALAVFVYGNIALRQFSDLDILIRREDIIVARHLLVSRGYRAYCPLAGARELAYLQSSRCLDHHYEFVREINGTTVEVELHWDITTRYFAFPLPEQRLWERLEFRSLAGQQVLNFRPEELLLILCAHGALHSWSRLAWICDVAALIAVHPELDWDKVTEASRRFGMERMLFLGLYLAKDFLGASLPEDLWQRLQGEPQVKGLAGQVRNRLFLESSRKPGIFEELRFHLKVRDTWRDRFRDMFRLVFTPSANDWALVPLPSALSFVYCLLRPFRLVGTFGLGANPSRRVTK